MDAEIDLPAKGAGNGQEAHVQFSDIGQSVQDCVMIDDNQVIAAFTALGHEIRWKLWRLLLPYGPARLPAGTIAARMAIVPSSLSFHLRQMTQAGVLIQRRCSRHIISAVNVPPVKSLFAAITALLPQSSTGLQKDETLAGDPQRKPKHFRAQHRRINRRTIQKS